MKICQLTFAGIFFLLTSSCVTKKRLIAVHIAQPSTLDTDMQGAIENEVYEAFSHASSRRIAGVVLPDASTFSDSVLHIASIRNIKYITILSDTWINTNEKMEGYKTYETCTLGFRVRVFDVRWKKMILNINFDVPDSMNRVYIPCLNFPITAMSPHIRFSISSLSDPVFPKNRPWKKLSIQLLPI